MAVDLGELLAQERDRLIEEWVRRLDRLSGSFARYSWDELADLGKRFIGELIHYLRRGDPGALRAFAATEGVLRLQVEFELAELIGGFMALRDVALTMLEGQVREPLVLHRLSRRLAAGADLIFLEFARQYQRLSGQVLGLPSFRMGDVGHHLDREIRRAIRFQRPLSLLLVQVDGYEEYMRLYGATLGELTVAAVTGILSRLTREVDIKCPVEAGVFAVILPETSIEDGRFVAERLRAAVASGEAAREQKLMVSDTTVSIGVVSFPLHGEGAEGLLEAARQTLTQAARLGRDTVVVNDWFRSGERVL